MLSGRVQGVVVQMTTKVLAGSYFVPAGSSACTRLSVRGKRTYTEGEEWSAYSTSASARAVWHEQHQ